MKFKLDFPLSQAKHKLSIRKPVFMAGSCFAENISERMRKDKFNVCDNPNGILFNPLSISKSISDCVADKKVDEELLFEHDGIWHSWEHHGRFSSTSKETLICNIINERVYAQKVLADCDILIITLGSAWIYELKESKKLVANCHKVPQQQFTKRLLSIGEIRAGFDALMNLPLLKNKHILLTVSPVRYTRDGLIENSRSKAVLLNGVHELCQNNPSVSYFPAYEIVMDELRDYRFYEADLVHPNALAIDYVYERFTENILDEETKMILKQVREIVQASKHRALNVVSAQHQEFLKQQLQKTIQLKDKYPFLDLEEELGYFGGGV